MWQTIGQSKIVDLLQRAVDHGTLSHAYLLIGPSQVGKMTLARDLAAALNCHAENGNRPCGLCPACLKISAGKHADVQVVALNSNKESEDAKERKEIGIEQIKDMLHSANLPPFEGKYRVYIIDEAGNLSVDAANRLLKTLEEPPVNVLFILLTSNSGLIPATVISRCQQLTLARLKVVEVESLLNARGELGADQAKLISRLSRGCPGWAIEASHHANLTAERLEKFETMQVLLSGGFSERFGIAAQMAMQFGKKRETVYETLDLWAGWWRDILLVKTGCAADIVSIDFMSGLDEVAGAYSLVQIKTVIEDILEAGEQLKLNASPRLVLEALMLNLPSPAIKNSAKQQVEVKHA